MKKKTEFIVRPNGKAYGTFIEFLMLAIISIFIYVCLICFAEDTFDSIPLFIGFSISWLTLIAVIFLGGLNIIYKRVEVRGEELTIRMLFHHKSVLKASDIKEYAFETHYKIGEDIHMIVVKFDSKAFILQDTFTKNFDLFAKYLRQNATVKPISPRK